MTSIQLIEIGHIDLVRLEDIKAMGNKSKVFRFDNSISKVNNPTFLNKTELTVYDKELATIQIKTTANFTIGIINRPLEDNFFARPINEKFIVVTTFDFEILELAEGVSIENYVLRFTYAFALIYNAYGGLVEDAHEVMQTNTRGCLFDMAIYKKQIAMFFKDPHISSEAKSVLNSKHNAFDVKLIPQTEKEIKQLKISWYYKYSNWMKKNPIWATAILFLIGLIFHELLGNFIYTLMTGK